ncbi:MAG: hypothetical protein LAO76_05135 [Acidobacteriia bacterium]|nr:hypothetical protein [Terriglobia bacterium]
MQSAAELEHWLRMNVGVKTDVTLLGRFDSVYFSTDELEMESLVLGGIKGTQLQFTTRSHYALHYER